MFTNRHNSPDFIRQVTGTSAQVSFIKWLFSMNIQQLKPGDQMVEIPLLQ